MRFIYLCMTREGNIGFPTTPKKLLLPTFFLQGKGTSPPISTQSPIVWRPPLGKLLSNSHPRNGEKGIHKGLLFSDFAGKN